MDNAKSSDANVTSVAPSFAVLSPTTTSIVVFLIATILYFFYLKKPLTVGVLSNPEQEAALASGNFRAVGIYLLLVIVSQFFVNVSAIRYKCETSIQESFAGGAMISLLPWTLIFGATVLAILMWPGFKQAFSNVFGYLAVSMVAGEVLNDLLLNTSVEEALKPIELDPSLSPEETAQRQKAKLDMQRSAESIIKLFGNTSVMINQIVPENFRDYWSILMPLKKPQYDNMSEESGTELARLKEELLRAVVLRDNVGEFCWYFYTAILVFLVVQYNLATRACAMNPAVMAAKYQKFVESENAQLEKTPTQVYASSS
jgi:hypothetical protein